MGVPRAAGAARHGGVPNCPAPPQIDSCASAPAASAPRLPHRPHVALAPGHRRGRRPLPVAQRLCAADHQQALAKGNAAEGQRQQGYFSRRDSNRRLAGRRVTAGQTLLHARQAVSLCVAEGLGQLCAAVCSDRAETASRERPGGGDGDSLALQPEVDRHGLRLLCGLLGLVGLLRGGGPRPHQGWPCSCPGQPRPGCAESACHWPTGRHGPAQSCSKHADARLETQQFCEQRLCSLGARKGPRASLP